MSPLLSVSDLSVTFPVGGRGPFGRARRLTALDRVSFELAAGEALGVVGESGCGKSTLARAVLRLVHPTGGAVRWRGDDLATLDERAMRARRREMQIVFQDPLDALDPRMIVGDSVAEPLRSFHPRMGRGEVRARVAGMLETVGLAPEHVNRYPHEFSGGQCQRIGIARALILEPELLVCDEPVSALDVSIQAQIVNLLGVLRRHRRLAMIFISHDLSVVRHVSDRILVLYMGRVVEVADAQALCGTPRHPYSQALIAAVPRPDPARERARPAAALPGELPSPLDPPSGCAFRTRCPLANALCATDEPALEEAGGGRLVACHHWRQAGA